MGVPGEVTLGDERRRRNREVFLFAFSFFGDDDQSGRVSRTATRTARLSRKADENDQSSQGKYLYVAAFAAAHSARSTPSVLISLSAPSCSPNARLNHVSHRGSARPARPVACPRPRARAHCQHTHSRRYFTSPTSASDSTIQEPSSRNSPPAKLFRPSIFFSSVSFDGERSGDDADAAPEVSSSSR